MSELTIRSAEEADALIAKVRAAAKRTRDWVAGLSGDPVDMLRKMKFDPVGFHPIEDRELNIVEQINQTWTYAVAITAARQLLVKYPESGGLHLAPGAHASLDLDIMSEEPGYIGAETFAAVNPSNNRKLAADLDKLATRPERHRFVFFMSPLFPGNERRPKLERDGVEVWSVDV